MERKIRSKTISLRFEKFVGSEEDNLPSIIACLLVIYTDLQIEFEGITASHAVYRKLYFFRKSLISLVEAQKCICHIGSKHANRLERTLSDGDFSAWVARSRELRRVLKELRPLRNGVSAHFGLDTAEELRPILEKHKDRVGVIGSRPEKIQLPIAGEFAVMAMQVKCPTEDYGAWIVAINNKVATAISSTWSLIELLLGYFVKGDLNRPYALSTRQ